MKTVLFNPKSDPNSNSLFGCADEEMIKKITKEYAVSPELFISLMKSDPHSLTGRIVQAGSAFAGRLTLLNKKNVLSGAESVYFLCDKSLFVFFDSDGTLTPSFCHNKKADELFFHAFAQAAGCAQKKEGLEKCVYMFFDSLISGDEELIEGYEKEINELEDKIEAGCIEKTFNGKMVGMRKKLLILSGYFEQLCLIGTRLSQNLNGAFDEESLSYFSSFSDRVGRLGERVKEAKSSLIQIRQEYTSTIEYNLNKIMKLHTVLTTVFLPLNLMVGWYGMNFKMPEFESPLAYWVFMAVFFAVAALVFRMLRKKDML